MAAIFTVPRDLGLKKDVAEEGVWNAMKSFDYKGSALLTISITALILGLVSIINHILDPVLTYKEPRWKHLSLVPSNCHFLLRIVCCLWTPIHLCRNDCY